MKDFEDLVQQVRQQIVDSVELEESEVKQLSNEDDLLASPLFLDSVDLLQVYSDCQRKFNVVFNNADYDGTHTVSNISKRIVAAKTKGVLGNNNAAFYSSNGDRYSRHEFEQYITTLIAAIGQVKINRHEPVRVRDTDPVKMMLMAVALVFSGCKPLLSAQPEGDNALGFDELMSTHATAPSETLSSNLYAQLERVQNNAVIGFETSGSTGVPVQIEKSLVSMLHEVDELTTLFDFKALDLVDAYVSPVHMYGFIWSFLLPLKLDIAVVYQSNTLSRPAPSGYEAIMAVSVPALWQSISGGLSDRYHYVVNSGGKFGQQRDTQFASLNANRKTQLQGIDVLGSTETGAIAYRMMGLDDIQTYRLLPTVKLMPNGEEHIIYSDFLPYGIESAPLDDKIEVLPNNQIRHLGRKDNVFKFKGKRYSLKAIEEKLSQLFAGHALRVYFIEQENNVRGGELIAFVEKVAAQFETTEEIRALFQDLPIPKIEFIDELPTNAMGKVTLQGLQEKVRNARV
ncbi:MULTISPECIES: AMP-binding protein [Pseudoalteromonas]|uniref:Acyl-coenzyme A synthetase/AMP-(Fatty) acid ligase n=1 Tax=Pseudoalteromonas luteoviolacea (strain 2ta16) TaxID=1353533 RepID=V4JAG5_PSEL2|nr:MULTISPECIES: AMP-binding protein [Pseudoalteromonas]ESP92177.1 acyl-coenzyme A synthetase/AMP-(fatty) acid ligase [Pseudoalteromonas luteoviolacea 2ta16]KZN29283.1 hypothetical protein N483_07565 [Pseudoalteromonas luteoviolacea NCIMB 1944]MCG7546738.1 AMP-binding protein [Pseudoalteromonas sp. Of7M-16]